MSNKHRKFCRPLTIEEDCMACIVRDSSYTQDFRDRVKARLDEIGFIRPYRTDDGVDMGVFWGRE